MVGEQLVKLLLRRGTLKEVWPPVYLTSDLRGKYYLPGATYITARSKVLNRTKLQRLLQIRFRSICCRPILRIFGSGTAAEGGTADGNIFCFGRWHFRMQAWNAGARFRKSSHYSWARVYIVGTGSNGHVYAVIGVVGLDSCRIFNTYTV